MKQIECINCSKLTKNNKFCSSRCFRLYYVNNKIGFFSAETNKKAKNTMRINKIGSFFNREKRRLAIDAAKEYHYKNKNENRTINFCKQCNAELIDYKTHAYKKQFCSQRCSGLYISQQQNHKTGWFSKASHDKSLATHKRNNTGFFNSKTQSTSAKCRDLKKHSLAMKIKWQDPIYKENTIKAILAGLLTRPTSYEQKISYLCFKYNLPFVYKGNGDFLINFKNPDFVNETDRVVIEVFYSYFKIRDYGSVENYKEFCRKKYESAGWKVIFIDEVDLHDENWETICLNKLKNTEDKLNIFINSGGVKQ